MSPRPEITVLGVVFAPDRCLIPPLRTEQPEEPALHAGEQLNGNQAPEQAVRPPTAALAASALRLAGLAFSLCMGLAAASDQPTPAQTNHTAISAGSGVTNTIALNFHQTPLNLVLEHLSEAGGFVINLEAEFHSVVDLETPQPVTPEKAVSLLNSALRRQACAATRHGRILTIGRLNRATSSDLEVITGNDPDAVQKSDEIVTQIVPVRYASLSELANNLQPLLPAGTTLSINESARALILVSTRTDVRRMLKIITALDSAIAGVSAIKVFPLRYADAAELAAVVQQLFGGETAGQGDSDMPSFGPPNGGGPGGPPDAPEASRVSASSDRGRAAVGAKVVALADERSNCLVVSAPEDALPTVAQVVERLDQSVHDTTIVRVFRLQNADPAELADQLAQLFPNDTDSDSSQAQAGLSLGGPPRPEDGPPGSADATQSPRSERRLKQSQVLAVADPRTSALLVSAASTLMPRIAAFIEQLDADPGRKETVGYWELQNADPQDVKQMLQALFNRNSSAQNNNNSLLGQNHPLTVRQTKQQTSASMGSLQLGGSSSASEGAASSY